MHTHQTPLFKACLHLKGSINKHNSHHWTADNLKELHQKLQYGAEVTGWYVELNVGTVESYFSDTTVLGLQLTPNVTLQSYIVSRPYLEASGINIHVCCFNKRWRHSLHVYASLAVIWEMFPQHLILHFGNLYLPL